MAWRVRIRMYMLFLWLFLFDKKKEEHKTRWYWKGRPLWGMEEYNQNRSYENRKYKGFKNETKL